MLVPWPCCMMLEYMCERTGVSLDEPTFEGQAQVT
jgi:hypothetical protein